MEYDPNWQANNNSRKYLDNLIERDKPKKLDNRFEKNFRIGGTCPSCEQSMYVDSDWAQFRKFCGLCGQRLDWS